jgi:hypothetical protein
LATSQSVSLPAEILFATITMTTMSTKEEYKPTSTSSLSQSNVNKTPGCAPDLIEFDGPEDPYNPLNWPLRKKVIVTMLYSFCTMGATWSSTAYVLWALLGTSKLTLLTYKIATTLEFPR